MQVLAASTAIVASAHFIPVRPQVTAYLGGAPCSEFDVSSGQVQGDSIPDSQNLVLTTSAWEGGHAYQWSYNGSSGTYYTNGWPANTTITVNGLTFISGPDAVTTNGTISRLVVVIRDRTLTSAPTIAAGSDGQEILLLNTGAGTLTIQDQGTLASSNLRLTASTIALATRQSLRLTYSSDIGDWVQTGPLMAVI